MILQCYLLRLPVFASPHTNVLVWFKNLVTYFYEDGFAVYVDSIILENPWMRSYENEFELQITRGH